MFMADKLEEVKVKQEKDTEIKMQQRGKELMKTHGKRAFRAPK